MTLATVSTVDSLALRVSGGLSCLALFVGTACCLFRRRELSSRLVLSLCVGPLLLAVCLYGVWRDTDANAVLTRSAQQVADAWREILDDLSEHSASSFEAPHSEPRPEDEARFGWSQRDPVSGAVLEWRGWTTDVDAAEWATLSKVQPLTARALVVQRGLETRLLLALASASGIRITERQLPTGLAAGPLTSSLSPSIVARARWFRLGEGLAPPSSEDEKPPSTQRVLVSLNDPSGTPVGRVALLYRPNRQAIAWASYLALCVVLGMWSLAIAPRFSTAWTLFIGAVLAVLC